jgi:hypothetical protein
VIWDDPSAVGVCTFTVADPGEFAAVDVAVTVTVAGFGATTGAVYSPVWSMLPFALPPVTAQITLWLVELLTVAVNCCWVADAGHKLPASFAYRFANPGLIVTSVPTVSVSVGVACVSVPSVPWIWKLKIPVAQGHRERNTCSRWRYC